jgi:hypothetical protein
LLPCVCKLPDAGDPDEEVLIMRNLPLAVTAVASIFVSLAIGSVAQTVPPGTVAPKVSAETAAPKVPPDLPLAVICFNQQTQTWAVGYLTLVNKDGSATHIAGDLSVTVNTKGVVQPPADRPAGGDCFGKTLKELRAAGRVMEFNAQVVRRPERAL